MFKVHQVAVHIFGIPKCLQQYENVDTNEIGVLYLYPHSLTAVNILGYQYEYENVDTNEIGILHLHPHSLTAVNILGYQKCAVSLDVP